MALEQSRFFDSVGQDRTYSAREFTEYFKEFLSNGIKNGGSNLQVSAGTGMNVQVGYGVALIEGYMYWLKEDGNGPKQIGLEAGSSNPRIDRVVLRLDTSIENRLITVEVKKGIPALSPVAPELIREGNIYELSLARINVRANTSAVAASDIVDERYSTTTCGLINGLVALDGSEFARQADDILAALPGNTFVRLEEVSESPQAGKLLKVDGSGKLPASITGDAQTVQGKSVAEIVTLAQSNIRYTREGATATQELTLWIKY